MGFFSWIGNQARKVTNYIGSSLNSARGITDNREDQQAFNSAEAQKQRKWEEYMSNTAHQREVADLKAAGLNPILSATGGVGSSTPSASSASSNMSGGNSLGDLSNIISSASHLVRSFNFDKNPKNDLTPKTSAKLIDTYAKIFAK